MTRKALVKRIVALRNAMSEDEFNQLLKALAALNDDEKQQIVEILERDLAPDEPEPEPGDDDSADPFDSLARRRKARASGPNTAWSKLRPVQKAKLLEKAPRAHRSLLVSHLVILAARGQIDEARSVAKIYQIDLDALIAPKGKTAHQRAAVKLWNELKPTERARLEKQAPAEFKTLRRLAGVE